MEPIHFHGQKASSIVTDLDEDDLIHDIPSPEAPIEINFGLTMFLESFRDCCSEFLKSLPKPELPFIPALIAGSLCSIIIIVLLYKKHYKLSVWDSARMLIKDLFVSIPETEHSEFMKCNIESCVRCKKSEELKFSIVEEWNKLTASTKAELPRIAESVKTLSTKLNEVQKNKSPKDKKSKTGQKPTIFKMDLSQNSNWTDLDCFHIEKELLKLNFKVVDEEFTKLLEQFHKGQYHGWKLNYIPSGHWCIFPIIDQGKVNEENCEKCPNTAALLGSFPSLMKDCAFGNACFSLLFPDSYIEPHYGPTNLRLRCHYGVRIPEDCWLEVAGTQIRWKEGESIIFDDSYQHSAYFAPNRENEKPRAVLLMDFWHPGITDSEKSVLLRLLKSDFMEE